MARDLFRGEVRIHLTMDHTADKRFFISLRGRQAGPFNLEELYLQPMRKNTPVWNEDLWAWTDAETIDALKDLFDRAKRAAHAHHRSLWTWLRSAFRKG